MKVLLLAFAILYFSSYPVQGILRSKHAWEDEVYFMVTLYDKVNGTFICGGVIIDHEWVLTAASCAQNAQGMWAVAGSYYRPTISSTKWQRPTVDYGIVHEKYIKGEPHYDLALLHISEPYVWTEGVRPVAMPQPGESPSGQVDFFGWGQVTIGFPATSLATGVEVMRVPVLDWHECRDLLPKNLVWDDRMVCTEQMPRQSFCKEDIGGPIVVNRGRDELAMLVGIAVWSYLPCGMIQYPNVYSQVSLYLDWIEANTRGNKRF
uniref:Peptidase S1 domain-containing protein n=1 Tax=Stomoxys calcitrans TaxID=35570 RepID=A0A1I8PAZ9_STOCA